MTVKGYWLQGADVDYYAAATMRKLADLMLPGSDGVKFDEGFPLRVDPRATPNMSVDVRAGWAKKSGYLGNNDALQNVVFDAANPSNPRIDLVVMRWRDSEAGDAESTAKLEVVKGTPSATPVMPSTTGMTVSMLAEVLVAAGATSIVGSAITDRRVFVGGDTDWLPVVAAPGYANNGNAEVRYDADSKQVLFRGSVQRNGGTIPTTTESGFLVPTAIKPPPRVARWLFPAYGSATAMYGIIQNDGNSRTFKTSRSGDAALTVVFLDQLSYAL